MNQTLSDESLRKIAKKKVRFRYSVKLHAWIFILVHIVLLCINLVFTPSFLWTVFPFFSWLIGLALHGLAYRFYAKGVYPMVKRATFYGITSYIFLMLLLFVTNYITLGTINWAFFPALFCGFGVLTFHIIYLIFFRSNITSDGQTKSRIDRAVDKEMEKMSNKRGV